MTMPTRKKSRATLSGAVQQFVHDDPDRSPQTNKQYGMVLGLLVDHLDADRRLVSIQAAELEDYVATLRTGAGYYRNRPLKDSTVTGYVTIIKAFFDWCVNADLLTSSPAAWLRRRKAKPENKASRAVPEDELQRMIAYCRWDSKRNYALIMFLADTACRVGGCASLQISRLDLEGRTAVLVEKGDKLHRVRFGPATAEALAIWLQRRPQPNPDHDYVWTGQGPDYQPLQTNSIAEVIRVAARKTGASRKWGPHSLRHAAGHRLAKGGVPVAGIQTKLGHSNPMTTMQFYMPGDDNYLRELSDQFAVQPPAASSTPENVIRRDDWQKWRPA